MTERLVRPPVQVQAEYRPQVGDMHQDFSSLAWRIEHQATERKPNLISPGNQDKLGEKISIGDPQQLSATSDISFSDFVVGSNAEGLRQGNVVLFAANTYIPPGEPRNNFFDPTGYPWHKEFYDTLFTQRSDIIVPVVTSGELSEVLNAETPKTAAVRSLEGIYGWRGEGGSQFVDKLWDDGIRQTIVVHNDPGPLGTGHTSEHGAHASDGLTELGEKFVREGSRRGMIWDLSHLSQATSWGILDITEGLPNCPPPVISHTGSRTLVPDTRNTRDDIAIEVARRGGLVGVMPAKWIVEPQGRQDQATVKSVVNLMEYYINLFEKHGGYKRIAIGTDFNGMGTESVITGLEDIQKLGPALYTEMFGRGWKPEVISGILADNAKAYYKKWLPRE